MPIAVTMPRMNDTMEDGTLLKWHVKEGDKVSSGDELADIETDKATQVLTSYEDGQVALINVKEGDMAKVGQTILVVTEAGESPEDALKKAKESGMLDMPAGDAAPAEEKKEAPAAAPAPVAPPAPEPVAAAPAAAAVPTPVPASNGAATTVGPAGRLRVSPVARKMAEENGLDLFLIQGSGPDGRIIKRDVKSALEKGTARLAPPSAVPVAAPAPAAGGKPSKPKGFVLPAAQPLVAETRAITGRRKTIARRLLDSKQQIPHFTVSMEVDAEPIEVMRKQINSAMNGAVRLSVNDFIMKGTAAALQRHPLINSSWTDQGIVTHGSINIGVAVAIPEEAGGGLVVPVIRDAHIKPITNISSETKALAKKSRGAGLSPEEMSDGTFTVSNLGMFGVDHFEAIINPPQAAILAIGAANEKPVVKDGQIVPGKRMTLTLSADHRVIDGAMAAEFLQSLKFLLENPAVVLV